VSQTCSACGAVHFRNAKPCAGALVVRDGRVLLGRRAVAPARGCWDIPGGFLDPWEHPADGAVREVAEETGLQVRLTGLLAVVVDTYHERDYTLNVYYLAEVLGGTEHPADDLAELRWFGPAELPEELAFPHCRGVLAAWQASGRQPGQAQASWMPRERWQALVRGEDCPLCAELAEPDQANPHGFPVAELGMSRLRLAAIQALPGYCALICRRHVRQPFELPLNEQVHYWHDLLALTVLVARRARRVSPLSTAAG
jgi:ADP-ribose pyrophosphatase YjhB (NUDIX family)